MKSGSTAFALVVVTSVIPVMPLAAQAVSSEADRALHLWVAAGSGITPQGGRSGYLGVQLEIAHWNLVARRTSNSMEESPHSNHFYRRLRDEVFDVGVLVGRTVLDRRHRMVISFGLARVSGSRVVLDRPIRIPPTWHWDAFEPRLGFPVEILFTYPFGSVVGVGVRGHGNINKEEPMLGVTLNVLVGRLR